MRLPLALALATALCGSAQAMSLHPQVVGLRHDWLFDVLFFALGLVGVGFICILVAQAFEKSNDTVFRIFFAIMAVAVCLVTTVAFAAESDGYHPDPAMTPGAVYSSDKRVICANSNASHPRSGIESLRPRIFTAYGIPPADWHLYQLDHLIDRGVGGADSVANLYPQRLDGPRGALVKDHQCDTRAWRMLCKDGSITVAQAQAVFRNWEVECPRVLHGVLPKVP